jgi:hypothetical protein
MNGKKILGITALLAVIVLGLMFTACPPADEDERVVNFINNTNSPVEITFQNAAAISLKEARVGDPQGGNPLCRGTVTKKGADIILNTITFTSPSFSVDQDLEIEGSVIGGKDSKNVAGVSLAYGTIIFSPKYGGQGFPNKIDAIPLDD